MALLVRHSDLRLAANAVAVSVEVVFVGPDDRHGPGVEGSIAATAFAVVVRRARIQTGAFVARVAFGRRETGFAFFGATGAGDQREAENTGDSENPYRSSLRLRQFPIEEYKSQARGL